MIPMVDVTALICPGCAEPAQDRPPVDLTSSTARPAWSHSDGSTLCPVIGDGGYVPADPIEIRPVDLTADQVRTFDGIMFNYGPFDARDILDVVDLIDTINAETGGDIAWADVSAVFSYFRRSHVSECDYAQSRGALACDCVRYGGTR